MIIDYKNHTPKISDSAFIAPNATVIGDVEIGEHSSVLFGSVVRGDVHPFVSAITNVQDLSVLHADTRPSMTLEDNVTIGHKSRSQLHS